MQQVQCCGARPQELWKGCTHSLFCLRLLLQFVEFVRLFQTEHLRRHLPLHHWRQPYNSPLPAFVPRFGDVVLVVDVGLQHAPEQGA